MTNLIRFGQNQNLAYPKAFNLFRLWILRFNYRSFNYTKLRDKQLFHRAICLLFLAILFVSLNFTQVYISITFFASNSVYHGNQIFLQIQKHSLGIQKHFNKSCNCSQPCGLYFLYFYYLIKVEQIFVPIVT